MRFTASPIPRWNRDPVCSKPRQLIVCPFCFALKCAGIYPENTTVDQVLLSWITQSQHSSIPTTQTSCSLPPGRPRTICCGWCGPLSQCGLEQITVSLLTNPHTLTLASPQTLICCKPPQGDNSAKCSHSCYLGSNVCLD